MQKAQLFRVYKISILKNDPKPQIFLEVSNYEKYVTSNVFNSPAPSC